MPLRLFKHSCNWLMRAIFMVCAVVAVLAALIVIVMRYWLLPDIERYHDKITASIANAIGKPVTIGKIEGDWRGLQPSIKLSEVRILDAQKQPAIALPAISTRLSWKTFLVGELRLASIELDRPELMINRDSQGKIFVGGIAVSTQGSDSQLSNWLLHQPHIVVSNALLVWIDELRDAPPLVMQQVNMRIENSHSQHRIAVRARPSEELATPLDIRGEFTGNDVAKLSEWRGQVFTQLDYTDVSAWKPWLNLPQEFSRGRGALRGWWGIEGGKLAHITADMDLQDVAMKLGDDVPEMGLHELKGRAAWKSIDGNLEISTKNLAMRSVSGVDLKPTDFYFRTTQTVQATKLAKPVSSELRANQLQLESLVSLANFLPLDAGLRNQLNTYGPRGSVTNLNAQWDGAADKPTSYKIKGKFENLALRPVGKLPGFSGLTLDVEGNDHDGTAQINTQQLTVDAPEFMREPLMLDTLSGQVKWQRDGNELAVNFTDVAIANQDLAGSAQGSFQTKIGTLGLLDLDANLTRADARSAARYIPLVALDKPGADWLSSALLAGHSENFKVRIKANLSDFPLPNNTDAIFQIGGHVQDAVMEFDKTWPRIEKISGDFLIDKNKLEVKSPSARTLTANLQNVTVTIPDLLSNKLLLKVSGEAVAENSVFLQYIQKSPVRGYIKGFTDHLTASGSGQLNLLLGIPLTGTQPVKVDGVFVVQDSDIDLGAGVPWLHHTQGALSFSETGMHAKDVATEIFGGKANLNVDTAENGAVHAVAQGRTDVDVVRATYPNALLNVLHGSAAWNADIHVIDESPQIIITSDLQGVSSTLPQPLTKLATETMPLRVELAPFAHKPKVVASKSKAKVKVAVKEIALEEQDVITAQLGEVLTAKILRRHENGAMVVKHGIVNFGDVSKPLSNELVAAKAGVWLTGSLPTFSLQGWEQLNNGAEKSNAAMPIAGANLRIAKLTGYGLNFHDLQVDALKRGDGLSAQLSGNEVNGEIIWQPHAVVGDTEANYAANGKLTAHLKNLMWQNEVKPASEEAAKPLDIPRPGSLPALEIDIDNLQFVGKQIGRIDMVGHPEGKDWRLRRLHVNNPDGELISDGLWHEDELNKVNSQVNMTLQIHDAGKVLARSGYPDAVKDGSGKLTANLSWQGAPSQFNFATLNGALNLDTDKGRFIQMDPGIGKLLSVLSLQALPKHLTLDFNDVFRQGFQFDSIKGNVAIKNGVMDTQDFSIDGSSAKVTMKGNANLNDTTQNIRVKVLPTIGSSVSLVTAFVVSPVVGLGTLAVNKILGNPLDKLASFEYNISGTWNDPIVVKLGSEKVKKAK
jgi:uncharacterized protein (TIGR02099 family)